MTGDGIDNTTRAAITAICEGKPPNGLDPDARDPLAELYHVAVDGFKRNGKAGAQAAVGAYLKGNPTARLAMAGRPEDAPRYELRWAREALRPQPPIDYVVEGVFSAPSVSLLVGDGGCGKTWLAIDLAVSVATEQQWLDFGVTGGPALIIDEEMGEGPLMRRIGEALRGHGAGDTTRLAFICHSRFDLWELNDVTAIIAAIREVGARLVVFDALMELLPGRDENSVKDVLPGLMALRDVATETGAALVVIHHANKSGGYRGSSALKGAVDNLLLMTKQGGLVTVATEKARFTEPYTFGASMQFGPGTFNLAPAVAQSPTTTMSSGQTYVLRYLGKHGASTTTDIEAHADVCSERTARNAIYSLTRQGYLERVDGGGPGTVATYDLTDLGTGAYNDLP